jgi:hypothetical protein
LADELRVAAPTGGDDGLTAGGSRPHLINKNRGKGEKRRWPKKNSEQCIEINRLVVRLLACTIEVTYNQSVACVSPKML